MAMLDRYRKTGGFLQLVCLLETSPPAKQEKFLSLIREEDPAWEEELKLRLLSFSRVMAWKPEFLGEIWTRIPEKVVAVAIWNLSAAEREAFLTPFTASHKRKLEEQFSLSKPTDAEILSCQLKILQEIRQMSQGGILRLEKADVNATIPENIEDKLSGSSSAVSESSITRDFEITSPGITPGVAANPAALQLIEEMKDLRKKLNAVVGENQSLKGENQVLKNKLEQIRKIA